MGNEPELVCKAQRCGLDVVELASMHSLASGSSLLEGGWTVFHSRYALSERRVAGVGIFIYNKVGA